MMDSQQFDELSQFCEDWTGRPWDGTTEHAAQVVEVHRWCGDALNAHAQWLRGMHDRADALGVELTTETVRSLDDGYDEPGRTPGARR